MHSLLAASARQFLVSSSNYIIVCHDVFIIRKSMAQEEERTCRDKAAVLFEIIPQYATTSKIPPELLC